MHILVGSIPRAATTIERRVAITATVGPLPSQAMPNPMQCLAAVSLRIARKRELQARLQFAKAIPATAGISIAMATE